MFQNFHNRNENVLNSMGQEGLLFMLIFKTMGEGLLTKVVSQII